MPELPTSKTTVSQKPADHIMMFYGPPGVGKTYFVNGLAQKVLFLSTDRGSRTLSAMRYECTDWYDFRQAVSKLEAPNSPHYDIVCIDHTSDMLSMAEAYVLEKLKVESLGDKSLPWGKGWKAYKNQISEIVQRIMAINTGVVYIAHEEIKPIRSNGLEVDKTMPKLQKAGWEYLVPVCDVVGFCNIRKIKGKETEVRALQTMPQEDTYAKDRTKRMRLDTVGGYETLDAEKFLKSFTTK